MRGERGGKTGNRAATRMHLGVARASYLFTARQPARLGTSGN